MGIFTIILIIAAPFVFSTLMYSLFVATAQPDPDEAFVAHANNFKTSTVQAVRGEQLGKHVA